MESALDDSSSTPDIFARHAAFLRRLARSLTATDADAEDLVQDTWVAAIERPPRQWIAPRAWLATAAARLSFKRGRAARRRAAHESRAARSEALTEPPELDRREDAALVLRDVVEATLALDEPARRTVVARYFEELSPGAIARREGVSVATVKGRLRRARARMRAHLDERHGGRRTHWCAALATSFGLPRPLPVSRALPPSRADSLPLSLGLGAAAMSLKIKTSAAISVALLIALGIALRRSDAVPAPLAPIAQDAGVEELADAPARAPDRRATADTTVAAEPAGAPPEQRLAAELEVLVTDLDGVPAPGVEILAAPPAHPLNVAGETGADGRLLVRWTPRAGAGELVVALRARGRSLGGLRRFVVPLGVRRRLVAAIDPLLLPRDELASARVTLALTRRGTLYESLDSHTALALLVGGEPPDRRLRVGPLEPVVERLEDGRAAFVADRGPADRYPQGEAFEVLGAIVSTHADGEEASTARVRGIVSDLAGLPAAGVRLAARTAGGELVATTRSGATGEFELTVPAGALELLAGSSDEHGDVESRVLDPGDDQAWNPFVDRGLALTGRVLDPTSAPRGGAHLQATHPLPGGDLWLGIALTDAEGRFALPNCPAQVLAVDFSLPTVAGGLPLARHESVAPGGAPWEVSLDPAATVGVDLRPLDDDPAGPLAAEVRVWDEAGSSGARLRVPGAAGTACAFALPPGAWTLTLGASGPHWSQPVSITLELGDDVDLGPVDLGAGGWLELEAPAAGEHHRVVRQDGSTESLVLDAAHAETLVRALPAGRYRVEVRSEEATPRSVEVEVHAGQTTRFPGRTAR